MKKNDLKQLIKPIVKECIQEALIEEGLLSNIVSEVAKGMQSNMVIEQQKNTQPSQDNAVHRASKTKEINAKLATQRAKMMEAVGRDAYNGVNLFEGTDPMSSYEAAPPTQGAPDLGHPADAGVDISSLVGGASAVWKAMK